MPGTNLTRAEANERAALLDVTGYTVELDLTTSEETFASTTTVTFTCTTPGAATFADLVGATVHSVTLNGVSLDPATVYADSRLALEGLAESNTLVVSADCTYSHTGEGLHRFVDPVDNKVYTYSQFEVPDARRVFTTFEQPDLKSTYTFIITAPEHWVVVSNTVTPEPTKHGDGKATWHFAPTERMSTYITALIAGEYVGVHDTYEGKHGPIEFGHYCRESLLPHLDREELVKITSQAFTFFEEKFDYPYPFGVHTRADGTQARKYDQLYVPEYNMGAMENAAAVTLRDEYLPRSRQPRSFFEFRTSVIIHELAHMWFGNLVTMKWWDDLWLNESFAEWACYWAEAEATEFTDAWTGFANARKVTGYTQDQLPTTHPIAADNYDLQAVEVNFDMITYAKGASVLKQLVAWVGLDPFLAGLRQYFKDFAFGNPEFSDLLSALEKASGRELTSWAAEWLQTAGVNTFTPEFTLAEDGTYAGLAVRQTAAPEWPTLRRHRVGIGFYNRNDAGALVRTDYLEVDVEGELTEITAAVGKAQPDLLLLNDKDLAYAKIRLDEKSLTTALSGLGTIEDSLARALIWGAAWDMTRDAEMRASEYVELVLANIATETDSWGLTRIPANAAQAVFQYSAPATRPELAARWESGLRELAGAAAPGSDHQLTFVRAFAAAARSASAIADLRGLLDGSVAFDGLAVDQDLRWALLTGLAATGSTTEAAVVAELEVDTTIAGQEKAAAVRAAFPTVEAKAAAWDLVMVDTATPNETMRSAAVAFHQPGQEAVLADYVAKYLTTADTLWEHIGSHKAAVALTAMFPRLSASPELLAACDTWLASTKAEPAAVRYVREGRDSAARALAAQARDAR